MTLNTITNEKEKKNWKENVANNPPFVWKNKKRPSPLALVLLWDGGRIRISSVATCKLQVAQTTVYYTLAYWWRRPKESNQIKNSHVNSLVCRHTHNRRTLADLTHIYAFKFNQDFPPEPALSGTTQVHLSSPPPTNHHHSRLNAESTWVPVTSQAHLLDTCQYSWTAKSRLCCIVCVLFFPFSWRKIFFF